MGERPTILTDEIRSTALAALNSWVFDDDTSAIRKTFKFADFSTAWAFMSKTALLAEKMDHHPEWFNVYNRVDVALTTHDAGGVTQLDIDMAAAMDRFAEAG